MWGVPRKPSQDVILKKTQTEMSKLRPLSARRQRKGENKDKSNPFAPPDVTDVFVEQDSLEEQRKKAFKDKQKMTLVQRQMLPTNVVSQKAIRERIERKFRTNDNNDDPDIKPVTETRQRQQHTAQIIQEQREIFLSNLLIDRHQKELERLNYLKHTKKAKIEDMQLTLDEDQNRSKTVRRQLEMTRDREKLHMEEQTQKRAEIESKVKKKKQNVDTLKAELNMLEQKRENYKLCEQLILDMEQYYGKKPETIQEFIEVFDRMETDNLFLIQNKQRIESRNEWQIQDLQDELAHTRKEVAELEKELETLREKRDSIKASVETSQNTTDLDQKLNYLHKIISKTYQHCFHTTDITQNSTSMLRTIESSIENLIKKVELVDKDWAIKQVKQINAERKIVARDANAAKTKKEAEERKQAIIERNKQPIKRRTGRPLVERIITGRTKKIDTDKLKAEQAEKERLDKLLFGDSIFD